MFKKYFLFTAIFLATCSSVEDVPLPITSTSEKAVEFFNKAVYHVEQGEWNEGKNNFQSALRIDPNFVMANLWGWSEDPIQNRKLTETAISNKDKASDAERLRVEMMMAGREGDQATRLKLAEELVEKYPNSSESYEVLADMYREQYKLDDAIANYDKALKINPDNFRVHAQIAQLHVVTGQNILLPKERQSKDIAIKHAEEMIRIRPKAPFAHQIRANIERADSNFEEAIKLYQNLVDVCNETGSTAKGTALLISGHNLMFSGRFDDAMRTYDEAISIANTPQTAFNYNRFKVHAHLFDNKYYEALDLLDEMLKNVGESSASKEAVINNTANIYWNKIMIQAHNQQKKEAFESLDQWKKYRKTNLDAVNKEDFQQRRVDGYNAGNYATEAWINVLFGEYERASSLLDKHYEIAKNWKNVAALDGYSGLYGMVYVMQGNPEKALDYFGDRITPSNNIYYSYFKALALKAIGRADEANGIFEYIANFNFLGWEPGLTRNLSINELKS